MREATAFKRDTLGYGLVSPLRRLASRDFVAAEGEALVRSCITQILGTKPGELPWRPDFGIDLEYYRQKNASNALGQEIAAQVVSALQDWEPRVEVSRCLISMDSSSASGQPRNIIRVRVDWVVRTDAVSDDSNVLIGPVSQEVAI